ncbi:unnamed protein product [Cunninghamella echinulata]
MNLYSEGQFIESYNGERTVEALKEFVLGQYNKINGIASTSEDNEDNTDEEELMEDEQLDNNDNDNNNQMDDDSSTYTDDDLNDHLLKKSNPTGESISLDYQGINLVKQSDRPYFIKFYAPWCPHCQNLAPTWVQMAKELKNQVDVAEVNCDDHKDICSEYGIQGFPTLLLINGDQRDMYSGSRSLPSLLEFAKKMAGPVIKIVNEAQYNEDLDPNGVAFVYLHKDHSDAALEVLDTVGKKFMNGVTFYSSTDEKLVRQYELALTDLPLAMIVKDGHHLLYPGRLSDNNKQVNIESVSNWIELEKYPLVAQVNPMNAPDLLQGERLVVLGFFNNNEDNDEARNKFKKLARKRVDQDRRSRSKSDRALFAQLDMDTYGEYVRSAFNIQKNSLPSFIILDGKNKQYFNRDIKSKLFSIDEPQLILDTLNEVVLGNIKGISTLSLTAKLVQHLQYGYNQAQSHTSFTFISFIIFGFVAYKIMGRRRKHHKSHLLPTTHQD